jgi:hypothetical protein
MKKFCVFMLLVVSLVLCTQDVIAKPKRAQANHKQSVASKVPSQETKLAVMYMIHKDSTWEEVLNQIQYLHSITEKHYESILGDSWTMPKQEMIDLLADVMSIKLKKQH